MHVLFVHGMGRSPLSGWPMLHQLRRAGFTTSTFGYMVSRETFASISERLTRRLVELASEGEFLVIGHSLGGVLLRSAIAALPSGIGPTRVFLLGSPMQPSGLMQRLGGNPILTRLTADCGALLASAPRMSSMSELSIPVTAIMGVRGMPLTRWHFADEPNDGIVSLAEVSAPWLTDQVRISVIHALLPASRQVADIIIERMKKGKPVRHPLV